MESGPDGKRALMSYLSFSVLADWLKWPASFSMRPIAGPLREKHGTRMVLKFRVWLIGFVQASLIFSALVIAWLLRFNFYLPDRALLFSAVPVLIAIRLGALARCGLFHGWWRYTDLNDAISLVKAMALGSVLFIVCLRFVLGNSAFPRAIYVLEPLLSTFLLGGARAISRVAAEAFQSKSKICKKIIVIGAGAAAERTIREIALPGSGYRAVACVDDNRSLIGLKIHGVPVLGTVDHLTVLAPRYEAKEILIAVPSASPAQMQRFRLICEQTGLPHKISSSMHRTLDVPGGSSQPPEIPSEELLGRPPVELDLESARAQLAGKAVLVTGAAGTIGSELCRQILQCGPNRLVCLDHNETGIFYLQLELSKQKCATQIIYCVTDLGDAGRMKGLLSEHQPSMIFHAAAYKHVPMMELNVYDAVKNNIFALYGLLDIAEENGCSHFLQISSDKAVNPTNIMGATKRVCELMISCRPTRSMRCISVRFGNVLGSSGSLVPILQKQLRAHQHLTITHPDITRFFMTTSEAVSLVLHAFAIGNHGDTLVLDMGSPIRIVDLARKLIRLSGKSERDVEIRFTGLRDGEKLFEELSYPSEEIHPTSSPKIWQVRGTPHRWRDLKCQLEHLRAAMSAMTAATIRARIQQIVPEYSNLVEAKAATQGGGQDLVATAIAPPIVLRPAPARPTSPRFSS